MSENQQFKQFLTITSIQGFSRMIKTMHNTHLYTSFFRFFHRSYSALHRRYSIEILLDHWATFCRGASQCLFFVSGSSRIRTHILVITMRMCYRYATLTPIIYHVNPHIRIDMPDLFIFKYHKYFILSIEPIIRWHYFNVKSFSLFFSFLF